MKDIKTIESFPLYWPEGYKRTQRPQSSRFGKLSLYQARNDLKDEVRRLGGQNLVISTNMRTRADGDVYSNAREPDDAGVAVYFGLKGKPVCFACDRWRTVKENTWAIAKTIDAMRGIDRWGVSELLDRMFKGFLALPATIGREWWEVLGLTAAATIEDIRTAYRRKSLESHPDRGGSTEAAAEVNTAYQRALEARKIAV